MTTDSKTKIQYTVYSRMMTLHMQGDRVEDAGDACNADEYGTHDSAEAAVAEAREIAAAPDSVKLWDQHGRGIGAIDHLTVWVDAFAYDEEADEWVPCDADGKTDDPCGPESVEFIDALDGQPKLKAAWDKAVNAKWSWLDYESEEYYTVRAFLDEMED